MKNKKRQMSKGVYLLMFTFLVVPMGVHMAALSLRNQSAPLDGRAQKGTTSKMDLKKVPLVDYTAPELSQLEERAMRQVRNSRYDGRPGILEPRGMGEEGIVVSHWADHMPALPVYGSNLIVLGEITDARAHLSNDKSNVYSEFTVSVEQVFKADSGARVNPGDIVSVDRRGGRVAYPSGHVKLYRVTGQGMPGAGKRYVFFLEGGEKQKGYSILTAYELRAGKVYPLDGSSVEVQGKWQFDVYQEVDEAHFLEELRAAIASTPQRPEGKE